MPQVVIENPMVAGEYGDAWIENELRRANEDANPLLFRMAFKMATGSGKTVVMAVLIAWPALNKLANPQDGRFSDAFLIVTPGITIRDRLRVLLPSDPQNYYRERDILPGELMEELGKAKIVITNYHAFKPRERTPAGKLTKNILARGGPSPFVESPAETVRRVCRELGSKKNIVVINDEAHHCYRRRAGGDEGADPLRGDERREAEKREEEARIWISGLEAVKRKIGVKVAYDLSATPFFLRGSGYSEGTLFPWVVSDFSLIDAIEAGIVKVPRVPVEDDAMRGELPTYRNIWPLIRDHLPKKGRGTEAVQDEPRLPKELEGALTSLYGFPGRHAEGLTDEDLLREVMNTVGKRGKLGENVKCVVSVIPSAGSVTDPKPGPIPTRVRALKERTACEITFPRLLGYRYELPPERLRAELGAHSVLTLSTSDVPTRTENAPIVGESHVLTLDDLKARRDQEVAFKPAKLVLEKYFRADGTRSEHNTGEHHWDSGVQAWRFPEVGAISRDWLRQCVVLKDHTFPQMLLLAELAHDAADRIYHAIVCTAGGERALKPSLRPYDTVGSTRYVDFDTSKPVYPTRTDKCHVSHVVADTGSWEQKLAQALEDMDEVEAYVKNQGLGFIIPYTLDGDERGYVPDFVVRLRDGGAGLLNLIVEVTGERKKDKAAKVSTARTLWVPAVNAHGGFGRWAFLEVTDPWDAQHAIRAALQNGGPP